MIGSGIFYIGGIVLERSGGNSRSGASRMGRRRLDYPPFGHLLCGARRHDAQGRRLLRVPARSLRRTCGLHVRHHELLPVVSGFHLRTGSRLCCRHLKHGAHGRARAKAIALGSILLLTLINIRGIRQGSMVQNIFMVLKLLPIALIIICGLAMGNESPNWFSFPKA